MDETTLPPIAAKTVSAAPTARTDLPPDAPWWARWIVANASEAWKMFSVNIPVIGAALIEVDQASGGQLMQLVPASWRPHAAAAALVGAAVLRLVNQKKGTT